jgi:hypothetical protein
MELALTDPLLWVLGSFALAVIATNVAWLALGAGRRGRAPSPGSVRSGMEPLIWLLTALFLLLPPIGAWWAGALSPYLMGLTETDWVNTLVSGGVLAAVSGGIIVFGWLIYRHKQPARPRAGSAHRPWLAPIDAVLLQWHWAFYRAGVIGWLALVLKMQSSAPEGFLAQVAEQPLYWGSWLGMILVAAEWALNPFARNALGASRDDPDRAFAAERTVIRMALAVVTTALFVLTRNFWLSLACHVIVETAIVAFLPVPAVPSPAE